MLGFLDRAEQFHLTCKVQVVKKSWIHPITEQLHETVTASLIPEISTAMMIVYGANLPIDVYKEPWEDRNPDLTKMWAMIKYPAPHFAQLGLCRGNHFVEQNHFHVLTNVTEEYLINKKSAFYGLGSNKVEITVYPSLTDDEKEDLERYSGILSKSE